jgi:cellulose synthase/poly-beta-1,6-N-acetylglucosamine synthase-like glycosyltransferase
MNNQLYITKTNDFHPKEGSKYFQLEGSQNCLSVIIPFFNEEANELKETLKSLYYCYQYLCKRKPEWNNRKMKIVIIQDGWYKASESMKEYLKNLYREKKWWLENKEFQEYDIETDGSITYIFEKESDIIINMEEVSKDEEFLKELDITMIIKIDNRKKHNSHEWFMGKNGFGESMKSKYMFCTDAFTMFNKSCLYHLVNYMDHNENVSVATGRQRVMTKEQQKTDEDSWSLSTLLRNVQLYDFESSNALYNGAFGVGGCLPVIPGPCGLYRSADVLQDNVRYWYFDIVNQEPNQTGLVLGNLRIAEDRILSYSVVLKTKEERRMGFVPMAVFYFEAELNLERFILQRRRWINGSVAGYIYLLLTNPEHLISWKTNIFRKTYISLLLLSQFLTYCIVAVAPAISLSIFFYSLTYVLSYFPINYITNETVSILVTMFFAAVYIRHLFVHHETKYNTQLMFILLIFSFVTSILTALSLLLYLFNVLNGNLLSHIISTNSTYLYLILIVTLLPFINSILISGRLHSFFYMIKSFPSYFLFSHMLISTFGSYSYSRIWDLSWGNRPTTELTTNVTKEELELSQKKFRQQSKKCIYFIILFNIIIFFIPKALQTGVVGIFFVIALIQMLFSFLYLLSFIPNKIKYSYEYIKNQITLKDMIREGTEKTKERSKELSLYDIENPTPENTMISVSISNDIIEEEKTELELSVEDCVDIGIIEEEKMELELSIEDCVDIGIIEEDTTQHPYYKWKKDHYQKNNKQKEWKEGSTHISRKWVL